MSNVNSSPTGAVSAISEFPREAVSLAGREGGERRPRENGRRPTRIRPRRWSVEVGALCAPRSKALESIISRRGRIFYLLDHATDYQLEDPAIGRCKELLGEYRRYWLRTWPR